MTLTQALEEMKQQFVANTLADVQTEMFRNTGAATIWRSLWFVGGAEGK